MTHDTVGEEQAFQQLLAAERPRLLWLCAHLLGDQDAAEDAAQEVIFAAWRHRAQLRSLEAGGAWLSGIARNVCAQWQRTHRRVHAPLPWADTMEDTADFTIDLERHELAMLLDRALALLPAETRAVLVQKYIEESPHAAIAAQLGLSENAVAVRVHRGRLALHKLLTTTFHAEAEAWGVVAMEREAGQTTRIWCPFCGAQKLVVQIHAATSSARFWCPDCRHHATMPVVWTQDAALLDGIKHHKPLLSRQLAFCHDHYQQVLATRVAACPRCSTPVHVSLRLPDDQALHPAYQSRSGVYIYCNTCGCIDSAPMQHFVLDLPQTRQFWRANPRIRCESEYEVQRDERAAIVTTYASVTTSARLVVIVDAETFVVRSIDSI